MTANRKATVRNIAGMARLIAPKAIERLEELLASDVHSVALAAAGHILDRAVGKPISMTADVTDRLDEFTDDELDNALDIVRAQVAAATAQDRSEDSPTSGPH